MRKAVTAIFLALVAAGLAGCGDMAKLPVDAGVGPNPALPPPTKTVIPGGENRPRRRLAPWAQADFRGGHDGSGVCHGTRASTLALCAAQWRRVGSRERCPAQTRGGGRHQVLVHE